MLPPRRRSPDPVEARTGHSPLGLPLTLSDPERSVARSHCRAVEIALEATQEMGRPIAVAGVLGTVRSAELHAAGAARPLAQIAALALAGTDVLPALPASRPAGDEEASGRLRGEGLTTREREIAALVASGLSNREIAARLVISKRTVDAHVSHIFVKLGLCSRVQLTVWLRDRVPA